MISRELREGLPVELLYSDDLILMAQSEESLHDKIVKLVPWGTDGRLPLIGDFRSLILE